MEKKLTEEELQAAAVHQRWVRAESGNFIKRHVARARRPGCKADDCPNIPGLEGIGKSSVVRALAEPWFTDRLPKIGDKDSLIQLAGILLLEIGDGSHIERTNPADLKNFLSASVDRYRGVFGRHAEDHSRTTIFVATTNDFSNLTSTTGNRRLPTLESRWARPELVTPDAESSAPDLRRTAGIQSPNRARPHPPA